MMLTVNDLIGLDYERLRNPISPNQNVGIGTIPQQNFYTSYPRLDQNQALMPNRDLSGFFSPQLNNTSLIPLGQTNGSIDLSNLINKGVANEDDVEQVKSLTEKKPLGIESLLKLLIPGRGIGSFLAGILPKESPEVKATKDFYARNYGVNKAGSVASGIMQGYNPVSGGFLNYMTGGRYGKPMQVGLANAARQRIENIAKRRAPQTDASRAKIQELQKFAEADTINRARTTASDVYRDAGNRGALGPGGGFSTSGSKKDSGFKSASSSPSGRGRQDY